MASPNISSPHNLYMKLRARCSTSPASSWASAESAPLCMASKPFRKDCDSLSPIPNRPPRKKNWRSEPDSHKQADDSAYESMTWAVINREISEWQNVCLTGYPSWWSPRSKWTQRQGFEASRGEAYASQWRKKSDHTYHPGKLYDEERRAVTDSYLADNNKVQDLAHLIAVQLLSACFTLPAECIPSYRTPVYRCFNAAGPFEKIDPRLISSLRMHTEARYSPSFGHQARNTSPTYRFQGVYDGASRARSHGSSSGCNSPDSELSRTTTQQRKTPLFLRISERSSNEYPGDGSTELDDLSSTNTRSTMSSWRLSNHVVDQEHKVDLSTASETNIETYPSLPNIAKDHPSRSFRFATDVLHRRIPDDMKDDGYLRTAGLLTHQALHSATRTEPHRVLTHPVKGLAFKRWQTLRRRFGYGYDYIHHEVSNRRDTLMPSTSGPSMLIPIEGSPASPVLSSDGKEGRRQVRESSGSCSDSMESNHLPHTHESGLDNNFACQGNPDDMCQDLLDRKNLGITEAIAIAFANSGLTAAISLCFTPPNSKIPSRIPSPRVAAGESPGSRSDLETFDTTAIGPMLSGSRPTSSGYRHSYRRHQRSNLSEICTPEEVDRDAISSRFNNPGIFQREGSLAKMVGGLTSHSVKLELDEKEPSINRFLSTDTSAVSSSREEETPIPRWPPERQVRRPSIVRTSTSGTQVFTPGEDGIELDGLPTGPPSEIWESEQQGKKRNQHSFL